MKVHTTQPHRLLISEILQRKVLDWEVMGLLTVASQRHGRICHWQIRPTPGSWRRRCQRLPFAISHSKPASWAPISLSSQFSPEWWLPWLTQSGWALPAQRPVAHRGVCRAQRHRGTYPRPWDTARRTWGQSGFLSALNAALGWGLRFEGTGLCPGPGTPGTTALGAGPLAWASLPITQHGFPGSGLQFSLGWVETEMRPVSQTPGPRR